MQLPVSDRAVDHPWDDVRRIYRRICLLRAKGEDEEAARLEHTELAGALSTARLTASGSDLDEPALLAEEAARVANATVLAELLAPLLAEQLRANPAVAPVATTSNHAAPALNRAAAAPAKPAVQAAPSITDLIDGMLSQRPARP